MARPPAPLHNLFLAPVGGRKTAPIFGPESGPKIRAVFGQKIGAVSGRKVGPFLDSRGPSGPFSEPPPRPAFELPGSLLVAPVGWARSGAISIRLSVQILSISTCRLAGPSPGPVCIRVLIQILFIWASRLAGPGSGQSLLGFQFEFY